MRLMARDGIEGVSMRAVNAAAGARNASAASYHFGNRQGLVEAVVDTLAEDLARVRQPLVEAVRKRQARKAVSPREIVEAVYLPYLGLFYHPDYGSQGLRFLSRLIVDTSPEGRVVLNRLTQPMAEELFELLAPALPKIPENLLKMRILFSLINLINGASDAFSLQRSPFGDMSYEDSLELASDFLDYIVAGLTSPPGRTRKEFVDLSNNLIEVYRNSGAEDA